MTIMQDVYMGINKARDHNAIVQIKNIYVRGNLCIVEGANIRDAIICDNHALGELISTLGGG